MILERSQHGLVQVLTLNRPEAANSLNPELIGELGKALTEIADDDATQVVVLTGAGERIFCAGMDLRAFSENRNESSEEGGGGTGHEATASAPKYGLKNLNPKPVIAAVNGAAVGGGFELVLSCDLVVAADTARFGLPEVKRGLLAAGGGTLLGTRLPLSLALEVALTGELIDAARAEQWGLVNRVVPAAELLEASLALAAKDRRKRSHRHSDDQGTRTAGRPGRSQARLGDTRGGRRGVPERGCQGGGAGLHREAGTELDRDGSGEKV